ETYDWSTGDNTSTITLGGIGATTGVVEYTVTVTDENGCSNSDTVVVTYENCIPAGLASIGNETGLELYPNPTSDGLAISLSGMNADNVEVFVVDITGRT